MGRLRAAVKRRVHLLLIAGLLLYVPTTAHADWSLQDWVHKFLNWWKPAPEESALAPALPTLPPIPDLLRSLQSRSSARRLAALDALAQSRDASPRVIASLVRATQDRRPKVADRALLALAGLCRAGHANEVMTGFSEELGRRPEPRLLFSDYHIKILDPAEDARAQAAFKGRS